MSMIKYKGIYRDVYNLHEKYSGDLSEADFVQLHKDMHEISDRYGGTKFVRDFLLAVVDEIERVYISKFPANKEESIENGVK